MSALKPHQPWLRSQQRKQLSEQEFDLLIIGGGASGAGVFLDALSRGLSVALVDMQDFTAGTSSRSTKLVHGGVRYLEQAVKQFDIKKLQLVKDALAERSNLLKMAPHLAWPLNIVTPAKNWLDLGYYRLGMGVYDWLAGDRRLGSTCLASTSQLQQLCPSLDAQALAGGVSFFDGQFDDARFGVAMVRTGLEMGGNALNYCQVESLTKAGGAVSGARCVDQMSGDRFDIRAKALVNCAGPWVDSVRQLANPEAQPLLTVSSGVHLVIEQNLLPEGKGLLIPQTEDGRLIFLLPWLGKTLVGTSDEPAELSENPSVSEAQIEYLLRTCNAWLQQPIQREQVSAAWSGLRPLVNQAGGSTAELSRDHLILTEHGLTTLTGGKWTTWRKMAAECVDELILQYGFKAGASITEQLHLVGARGDTLAAKHALAHLPEDIQQHLWHAYGDRAAQVLRQGSERRLLDDEPFIEAEIHWILHFEGACKFEDLLNRRLRIGMLNEAKAAQLKALIEQIIHADEVAA